MFATCGEQVDIWDENRAEPVRSFTWGVDTIHSVKFNPIEVQYDYPKICPADYNTCQVLDFSKILEHTLEKMFIKNMRYCKL